jgi:hypothetical protein|tara:strand:+ start:566 stop:757 length:192 start_codon:yes stop_codon:yes gene_type:complete
MFIDANEITALINKYEKLVRDGRRVSPVIVIKDLEGLIDKESARIEQMMDRMSEEDYFAEGGF